jgi:hypothetical protein
MKADQLRLGAGSQGAPDSIKEQGGGTVGSLRTIATLRPRIAVGHY